MSSRNKGKGVGKGQSNRHKSNQVSNKKRRNDPDESKRIPQDTRPNSLTEILETTANNMKMKSSEDLQAIPKYKITSTKQELSIKTFSREDPLMADLLWRSVVPKEERIPRISQGFTESEIDEIETKLGESITCDANNTTENSSVIRANKQMAIGRAQTPHSLDSCTDTHSKYSKSFSEKDDPLMSDLLWEKVDTDDECIPRRKQDPPTSEEDSLYSDTDTNSNQQLDSFLNDESGMFDENVKEQFKHINSRWYNRRSAADVKFPTQNNVPNVKLKRKKSASLGLRNKNTQIKNQDSISVNTVQCNETTKYGQIVTKYDESRRSSMTKRSRKKKTDVDKKVNELLTQQLSIMWCLKEFENKPSDTDGESDNKANVLGQVIRQGKDIYFQPSISSISQNIANEGPSTSLNSVKSRIKKQKASSTTLGNTTSTSHQISELESGEIESDTTTLSLDTPNNIKRVKKKKKPKKSKRSCSVYSKYTSSGREQIYSHVPKSQSRTRHCHARNRFPYNKFSTRRASSKYIHAVSSSDDRERTKILENDEYKPSRRISTESNRSRDKSRSTHIRGCTRSLRRTRNYAYDDVDSSPESYRNVSIPKNISNESLSIQDPKEKMKRDHFGEKDNVSYYLRRKGPNATEENHWIIVENDFVL